MTGDHLLLRVARHPQRIVADGERADRCLLPDLEQHLLFLLEALPGEPEEHQHDADVDDVAAVAAPRAADEPDHRRQDVGAGRLLAHVRRRG